jgi:methylmalonyl-CoA/ethylmalonyl-CoA epimerase
MDAMLDHVGVAVPDIDVAAQRWGPQLGAVQVAALARPALGFEGRQFRYRNNARLELLAPLQGTDGGTLMAYLRRFGSGLHHVTIKVTDLDEALAVVHAAGFETVEEDRTRTVWHEAFVRPAQLGGVLVQIGWEPSPLAFAVEAGTYRDVVAAEDGAIFDGAVLRHPEPARLIGLLALLEAKVHRCGRDRWECTWEGSPLRLWIEQSVGSSEPPGAALAFREAGEGSRDPLAGPAIATVVCPHVRPYFPGLRTHAQDSLDCVDERWDRPYSGR